MKVFSVVGYSETGKTTVSENIIKELVSRGHTVGTAKSIGCGRGVCVSICDHHRDGVGFSLDQRGTDTFRHMEAGASQVTSWALGETAVVKGKYLKLYELIAEYDTDFLLIEGGKSHYIPRIITAATEEDAKGVLNDLTFAVSGKIGSICDEVLGIKTYDTNKDIKDLVDKIEDTVQPTIAYADVVGCDLCGMSCNDLLDNIYSGKADYTSCLKRYPDVTGNLSKEDLKKIKKMISSLELSKNYKSFNIQVSND